MQTTHHDHGFEDLDPRTAAPPARAILDETKASFGVVPSVVARMAHSPELYRSFMALSDAFKHTTLTPLEQESVILTFARDVGCEVCIAMHQRLLAQAGGAEVGAAILAAKAPADARSAALVAFTEDLLRTRGDVTPDVWASFLAAGYTRAQALEIVLGFGAYTMSTFANRLTGGTLRPARAPAAG